MKIRRLPDIDLARVAVLSENLQRRELLRMSAGHPPFSYAPFRTSFPDIMNVAPAMFGATNQTDWAKIEEVIRRTRMSPEGIEANLAAAKALHDFAAERAVVGRRHDFLPMQIGNGQSVNFWHPMLVMLDGRQPVVPFIEPRRSSTRLTSEGRRFAFSMMHERIRAADPDFAAVELAIIQFTAPKAGPRKAVLHTAAEVPLFSLSRLEEMVATTLRIWAEITQERAQETRRRGTGTTGPLL